MSAMKNSVHPLVVHLVLTYHWFDEMVNLRKHVEYRAMTPHWKRLIWDRRNEIAAARFSRGYTAETIVRPVIGIDVGPCPYNGWDGDYYRLTLGLITEHNRPTQMEMRWKTFCGGSSCDESGPNTKGEASL